MLLSQSRLPNPTALAHSYVAYEVVPIIHTHVTTRSHMPHRGGGACESERAWHMCKIFIFHSVRKIGTQMRAADSWLTNCRNALCHSVHRILRSKTKRHLIYIINGYTTHNCRVCMKGLVSRRYWAYQPAFRCCTYVYAIGVVRHHDLSTLSNGSRQFKGLRFKPRKAHHA